MKFLKTLRDGTECEMIAPASMKDQLLKDERIRVAEGQPEELDRDELVAKALEIGVVDKNGKPVPRSVLERWSTDRLEAAIAEAAKPEA